MKSKIVYVALQIKTLLRHVPKLIAATIVLAVLAGTIAFCGTKLLYGQSAADHITVALVVEDDSALMQLGLKYLESSESIHTFCTLTTVSKEEAQQMLREKRAAASIYFPPSFTDDVVSGKNTPAVVTFSSKTGMEELLFDELARAASYILSCAQASIYTIHDLYDDYAFRVRKGIHYDYINERTLETAFIRAQLFEVKNISSTGTMSVATYYTASGMVLLFFLSVMACGNFLLPEQGALCSLLKQRRIGIVWRTFSRLLAVTLFFSLFGGVFFAIAVYKGFLPHTIWMCLVPLTLLAVSRTMFFYSIARNQLNGTLLTFFITFLCMLLSGSLVPFSFLPDFLSKPGTLLPTHYAHTFTGYLLEKQTATAMLLPILAWSLVFFVLTCIVLRYSERRLHTV